MRQYRGCSRLVYAVETEAADGSVTYGAVKTLAPVKTVSREIAGDNEQVYADNKVQEITFAATTITRSFDVTRIDPAVVAEIFGNTSITLGDNTAYATKADGSARPYIAIGYALHDGNADQPCEIVWCYHCKVDTISKASNTIDTGTGSEGQSITITNAAPKKAWTQTAECNLDMSIPLDSAADNTTLVNAFFAQVTTPDNASTVLNVSGE